MIKWNEIRIDKNEKASHWIHEKIKNTSPYQNCDVNKKYDVHKKELGDKIWKGWI